MISFIIDWMFKGLSWLPVLGLVVFFHEWSHYAVARAFNVRIDQFSIGFGPKLLGWRNRAGVEWRLSAFPLGGYVKFSGDANAASLPDAEQLADLKRRIDMNEGAGASKNYFHFKPVWQRALIVLAGPVGNFVLSIVIFSVMFGIFGEDRGAVKIESVFAHSAAEAAGFKPGDLVIKADGVAMRNEQQFVQTVWLHSDTAFAVDILRAKQPLTLSVTPRRAFVAQVGGKMGQIGVSLSEAPDPQGRRPMWPWQAVAAGVHQTWYTLTSNLTYVGRIFVGKESGDQLGGPIRTMQASSATAKASMSIPGPWWKKTASVALGLLGLSAALSVGLGFLNLLPVPMLDGGHLVFFAYEAVAGKPLDVRIQEVGYRVGLALVVGLMLFATRNDLTHVSFLKFLGGLS